MKLLDPKNEKAREGFFYVHAELSDVFWTDEWNVKTLPLTVGISWTLAHLWDMSLSGSACLDECWIEAYALTQGPCAIMTEHLTLGSSLL